MNAWVTLVMLDDSYVAGAITLAKSLRSVNTKYPIICMYADISEESILVLNKHFDKIIKVPLIDIEVSRNISEKASKIYNRWNNYSLTVCNILNPEYGFNNVVVLNADVLIRRNIDELFNIHEPAAMFSSPWSDRIFKTSNIKNHYGNVGHLERVSRESLRNSIVDGFALTGNMYVLQPSEVIWKHFQLLISGGHFGNSSCYASGSEQMIATILHDLYNEICPSGPLNIGPRYCCNVGKAYWMYTKASMTEAYSYHFGGCHPWEPKYQKTKYSDVIEWMDVYKSIQ